MKLLVEPCLCAPCRNMLPLNRSHIQHCPKVRKQTEHVTGDMTSRKMSVVFQSSYVLRTLFVSCCTRTVTERNNLSVKERGSSKNHLTLQIMKNPLRIGYYNFSKFSNACYEKYELFFLPLCKTYH